MVQRHTLRALLVLSASLAAVATMYAQPLSGEPVSVAMAKKAVLIHIEMTRDQWSVLAELKGTAPGVKEVKKLEYPGTKELLGYVVELAPKGFVVVSARTDISPIISFDYQGNFPWQEDPENPLLWMLREDLTLRNKALPNLERGQIQTNIDTWKAYLSSKHPEIRSDYVPKPHSMYPTEGWVGTTWSQGDGYNNCCPLDTFTRKRCATGCVATAMAQILNFWAERSNSINAEFTTADSYTSRKNEYLNDDKDTVKVIVRIDADSGVADFPSFTIVNTLISTLNILYQLYPDYITRITAGPVLSFASGIAVKVNYSSKNGTSGATNDIASALKEKFHFSSARAFESSVPGFYDTLFNNMIDTHPAALRIGHSESDTRHAIVCDGVKWTWFVYPPLPDTTIYYHLNFGWGSGNPGPIQDAWYKLPNGMPKDYNVVYGGVMNIVGPK